MANHPLFVLFILTALSSADSSRLTTLDQVAPQPQRPLPMGPTSTPPPNGPGPGPVPDPSLSFFMHDIMGGTHPSARTVTGTTPPEAEAEAEAAAGLPFSKPNKNVFPVAGGVPLVSTNRNSNGGNEKRALVTFGSLTAIDDEVTEGEELGSGVVGRAQGFYFVSSLDGSSHTVALTVVVHSYDEDDENDDTISFFGVHRRVSPESLIAVVGGTGKYENAGGFAVIENLRRGESQHLTDGVDTIAHFTVYLSYD